MNAFKLVAERIQLSQEDWIQIIEARRALLGSNIDSITLRKFGDLKIPIGEGADKRMANMAELDHAGLLGSIISRIKNLSEIEDMQGMFHCDGRAKVVVNEENGHVQRYAWGISRRGKWIIARFDLFYRDLRRDPPLLYNVDIQVEEVNELRLLIAKTMAKPEFICAMMSRLMYSVEQRRKELLAEISRVADVFHGEDILLRAIAGLDFVPPPRS
jgi:hypothetical protein